MKFLQVLLNTKAVGVNVPTAMITEISVLWVVAPCCSEKKRRFGETSPAASKSTSGPSKKTRKSRRQPEHFNPED